MVLGLIGFSGLRLLASRRSSRRAAGDGEPAGAQEQPGPDDQGSPPRRTRAEWTGLIISVGIVLALVGLVGYQAVAGADRPAALEVRPRLEAVWREAGWSYLPVEVANFGALTAEDILVRLSLASDDGEQESAEFTIRFLAGGAREEGVVVFRGDPARGRLTVAGLSYVKP
jgi:uncharacterized protein (TIGR02588 family)